MPTLHRYIFTFDDQSDQPKVSTSDPVITELTLSEHEVELTLKSLDINKATGPDGIPAKLLKETASIIAPSLCKLFNKSLHLGAVPEEWKLANVVPVFKKGDKSKTESYRPASHCYQLSLKF